MGIDPATLTEAAMHAHRDVERRSPGRGSHTSEAEVDLNSHDRTITVEPRTTTTAATVAAGSSTARATGANPVTGKTSTRASTSAGTGPSTTTRRSPQSSGKPSPASKSTPPSPSRTKQQPPGPVLVNPAPPTDTPSESSTMYLSSPFSLRRHPHALDPSSPSHQPSISSQRSRPEHHIPPETHFSFADILTAALDEPAAQADVDAIAALCGRSRLSLASAHAAHRRPIGALDADQLSTVEEMSRAGDAPLEPGAHDGADAAGAPPRRGYDAAGVWQGNVRDRPPTAGGMVALSGDAASLESRASSATSLVPERPAEGDSRAVRSLMRVAGGG